MKHFASTEDPRTLRNALVMSEDQRHRDDFAGLVIVGWDDRPEHQRTFECVSHGVPFMERALERIVRDLFKRFEDFEPTTSQIECLIDMRGGCRCFICPPCNACVEPVTADEFLQLIDGEESA